MSAPPRPAGRVKRTWRSVRYFLVLPVPQVPALPARLAFVGDPERSALVMHEYDAIRNEINTSLQSQVSVLSFGSATSGLLVAAAATLWKDEPVLAGVILMFVVPSTCFLTLAFYTGEMVRLMRAGLFLNYLENCVNDSVAPHGVVSKPGVLLWEQWGIRRGPVDMARNNRTAITLVFGLLAVGFMVAGFLRLHETDSVPECVAVGGEVLALLLGIQAFRWIRHLSRYAYLHRKQYVQSVARTVPRVE